ncbi:MAG: NADPH-dependent FMN reductase [Nitriliruptoraceae bacterium]
MHILGLCGSLRAGSLNRRLLEEAGRLLPDGATLRIPSLVGELPLFDEDLEEDPLPEAVRAFHDAIAAADAILVASPEYNGSVTGPLKNALDWASRPAGDAVLAGKALAVIGASPSRFGAAWAQAETRRISDRIGARVVPLELPVARADQALGDDGRLQDPELRRRLERLVTSLVDLAAGRTDLDAIGRSEDAVAVGPVPPSIAA